jgi:uncharacterized protein YbjT (DUF2867 family)
MGQNIQNILVIGANGSTGQIICNLLQDSPSYRPVAMIRGESQKEHFEKRNIRTVLGDLEKDFEHAFENINRVIFAAGAGGSSSEEKTISIDQEGAKRSVALAKKYHIQKFVMLSSMGAEYPDKESKIYNYLKAKHSADEYLKNSGVDFTIVRPGNLTDKEGEGKIQARQSFDEIGEISREDVALTLVHVLGSDIAPNSYFEIIEGDKHIVEAVAGLVTA